MERAFRTMKTVNLHVRPILHRATGARCTLRCRMAYEGSLAGRILEEIPAPVILFSGRTLAARQTSRMAMAPKPTASEPCENDHYPKYMHDPARPAGYQSRARNPWTQRRPNPKQRRWSCEPRQTSKTQAQPGRTQNVGRKSSENAQLIAISRILPKIPSFSLSSTSSIVARGIANTHSCSSARRLGSMATRTRYTPFGRPMPRLLGALGLSRRNPLAQRRTHIGTPMGSVSPELVLINLLSNV